MILSSPFSRHNRSHQTWTNGTSHHSNQASTQAGRKPAPQQPAPQQPKSHDDISRKNANGRLVNNGHLPFRSQTLNRLDNQRQRANQQPPTNNRSSLQRNLSSLGHYTTNSSRIMVTNGGQSRAEQIYAPASIANPGELAHYKQPIRSPNEHESQHYAATSFTRAEPNSSLASEPHSASVTQRSGCDSALGSLLERFGTLRRRAKWSKSSRSKVDLQHQRPASALPMVNGGGSMIYSNGIPPTPPPSSVVALDPEIYATGKREVAAEEIYAEGSRAIDSNGLKRLLEHQLDESLMAEGETRTVIEEQSKQQADYKTLISQLTNWINDELAQQRIIVKDLQDDLYDGQILGKLIEKLHQIKLDLVEVTQNERAQRHKLRTVLDTINRILTLQARWARIRWSVEGIHSKNMVEIVHLLVTLALYHRAPIKLAPDVRVRVLVVQKNHGQLVKRTHEAQLTDSSIKPALDGGQASAASHRDAFDTLLEFAPEKLTIVKQSLVNFVNRHLNKIKINCFSNRRDEILDPDQFSDGLLFVFLIASLEDYFVPLGNLFTAAIPSASSTSDQPPDSNNNASSGLNILQTALEPTSYINTQPIHKLHNVNVAIQLIEEAGVSIRDRVRAEDIVNGDLKSVLRVLYALFSRYKHI